MDAKGQQATLGERPDASPAHRQRAYQRRQRAQRYVTDSHAQLRAHVLACLEYLQQLATHPVVGTQVRARLAQIDADYTTRARTPLQPRPPAPRSPQPR